ncbi:MAG: hypothetical protein ACNYNX_06930 [Leucobacter sp.]
MATADQTIAQDSFSAFHNANYTALSADDAFERFAVGEIALRREKLGGSEIENGLVGSASDGGIDALFIFLNRQELVEADSVRLSRRKNALAGLQAGLRIDVMVVHAKNETKWDTNVFPKIESSLKAILDPYATAATLRAFPLNNAVVEKALILKKLREKLSSLVPVMVFNIQYVTFAPESNVDTYMKTKQTQLQDWLLSKLPSGSSATVKYVGDSSIVTQLRVSHDFQAKLVFTKAPVRDDSALVGLVKTKDYIKFLREERSNVLREQLFAVNVRDYAGVGRPRS